jgi:hypothetical protein
LSTETSDELADATVRIESLYGQLAAAGVQHVHVTWYGSGDEGGVQEVDYKTITEDGVTVSPEVPLELDRELAEAFDAYLFAVYEGWFNEDGGSGYGEIDVAARTTTIHHSWFVEQTEAEPAIVVGAPPRTPLETAQEQLHASSRKWTEAVEAMNRSEARYAALVLLKLVDEYPAGVITGFTYETDWNSDDEGGFFSSSSVWADVDVSVDGYEEAITGKGDPNDADDMHAFSEAALELLASENETITLDRLREIAEKGLA